MGNDTYCSGCNHPCGLCYLTRVCQTVGCAQCNHGPKFMQKGSDFINTLESVPVAGYAVSGHYARFDQNDDAIRVAAKCTKSTLTTIGGIAGGVVGQPHIGAMIGNGIGIGAQHGIKQHIKDSAIKNQISDPTFGSVVMDLGISGVTSFVGGQGSDIAKQVGMNSAKQFVSSQVFSGVAKNQLNSVKNSILSQNQKTNNYSNNNNQVENLKTYSNTQNLKTTSNNPEFYYALFSFKNRKYLSTQNGLSFSKDQIGHTTQLFYQVQKDQDFHFYTYQKQLINPIAWELIQFDGYICFIDPYKPHLFCCCTNTGALGWTQQEGDQSTMFAVQKLSTI